MSANKIISDSYDSTINTSTIISFDDLKEIKKSENDNCSYSFLLTNYQEIISYTVSKIVDPSYEPIFKKIFEEGNNFNNKTGEQRLISFLNSIIFPDEKNDIQIYEIQKLPNESTIIKETSSGILWYDILCKAKCKSIFNQKYNKIINIEMQLSCDYNINQRLLDYATSAHKKYKEETIVLCLINKGSDKNDFKTSITSLRKKYLEGRKIVALNDFKIFVLNLPELINKIKNREQIIIEKKEIKEIG